MYDDEVSPTPMIEHLRNMLPSPVQGALRRRQMQGKMRGNDIARELVTVALVAVMEARSEELSDRDVVRKADAAMARFIYASRTARGRAADPHDHAITAAPRDTPVPELETLPDESAQGMEPEESEWAKEALARLPGALPAIAESQMIKEDTIDAGASLLGISRGQVRYGLEKLMPLLQDALVAGVRDGRIPVSEDLAAKMEALGWLRSDRTGYIAIPPEVDVVTRRGRETIFAPRTTAYASRRWYIRESDAEMKRVEEWVEAQRAAEVGPSGEAD